MTRFTKANLLKGNAGYVQYSPSGRAWATDNRFVARFRHGMGGPGTFMTHLRKNWTVEDFFAQIDAGKTPLAIAESTGYILPHIKKWMRQAGFPTTQAGYKAWAAHQRKLSDDRLAKRLADPEFQRRKALREKEMASWTK